MVQVAAQKKPSIYILSSDLDTCRNDKGRINGDINRGTVLQNLLYHKPILLYKTL